MRLLLKVVAGERPTTARLEKLTCAGISGVVGYNLDET
jgi:hypothetical protein